MSWTPPDRPGAERSPRAETIIPYRLRIGVTGHRTLPADPALRVVVEHSLTRVLQALPAMQATPIRVAVVSPLAEGADRLVASVVLAQAEAQLEAVLPLPQQDYMLDFVSEPSRREFADLLARAARVVELPRAAARDEAYEQAGQYVVEQSDVLFAVWDGQQARGQGGTADIVSWAQDRGTPVVWIDVRPPFAVSDREGHGVDLTVLARLEQLNSAVLPGNQYTAALDAERGRLLEHARNEALDPASLEPFMCWVLPTAVRVDLLATRAQRQFFRFSDSTFVLAVLAVLASASPQLLGPGFPPTPFRWHISFQVAPMIECLLMCAVLLVIHFGHRRELHLRWIAYRFLAERLRAAFFMALVGAAHDGAAQEPEFVTLHQPSDPWIQRAFDEVWQRRPDVDAGMPVQSLRGFLARTWIGDQRAYQDSKSRRHAQASRLLGRVSVAVFAVTLGISALDAFQVWNQGIFGGVGPTIALYLSIVFPALAGALGGIGALREHPRNAHRSNHMARRLARLERHMERAPDLATLRALAHQTESLMVEESGDWFVTMEFRDIAVHT